MKHQINAVKIFHETYNLNYKESPIAHIGNEKINLRFKLMSEENEEYLEAAKNNDLVEVADALGDMLYITLWNNN
tara:strand:- start:190 stop:414 length:225 start_codon:yes stop_codon:yes gene_type:complete